MQKHQNHGDEGNVTGGIREVAEAPKLLQSPLALVILALGLVLVVGVPYFAFRTLPGADKPLVSGTEPAGDPNATLDLKEFDPLTEDLKEGSRGIFIAENSVMPDSLEGLPAPSGSGLIYPVTEAVEAMQPALSWTSFAPGPFTVELKNKTGELIARMDGLQTTGWLVPVPLERGAAYNWQVTGANKDSETASFVVLSTPFFEQWQRVRLTIANSHLALGTVAEQLGLLSIAEREYQAAVKVYPQAEAPGRLLTNVMALRDPAVKDNTAEPLLP